MRFVQVEAEQDYEERRRKGKFEKSKKGVWFAPKIGFRCGEAVAGPVGGQQSWYKLCS